MTFVKICGLREPAHALAAAEAGADFIGLVFAESRRRVSVEEALAIVRALGGPPAAAGDGAEGIEALLRRRRPLVVGVFAGADAETVNRTAEAVGLDLVQLSGDEPWDICDKLSRPVLKAVKVKDGTSAGEIIAGLRAGAIPLLDTVDTPGWVLMISKAGRTVWAVVCAAPDTMPSTMSLCTSMVPK